MLAAPLDSARTNRRTPVERTCVACGRQDSAELFLRVVCAPHRELAVDLRRNLRGRGANVCFSRECIETALKRRLFGRTLKSEIRYPKVTDFVESIRRALWRQLDTLARSGAGSRRVVLGADLVAERIRSGRADCLLVAADSAKRERLCAFAVASGVPFALVENKEILGAFYGRSELGVAAVCDPGLARAILRVSKRLEEMR